MEIGPISGIGLMQAATKPQGNFDPPEVFDIEGSARLGDGERQRNGRKAAGAEENEDDDLMVDAETESGEEGSSRVDYFA